MPQINTANSKKKIFHIHSDPKFLHDINRYSNENFSNVLIVIGEKANYRKEYHDNALFFLPTNNNLEKIKNLCENADLVIINDLNSFKAKLVLLLPNNIKIGWRFFGYELYSKKKYSFLSSKSRRLFWNERELIYKLYKQQIKDYLQMNGLPILGIKTSFIKAIERINFINCICEEEYYFIKKLYPHISIPLLVKLSLSKQTSSYDLDNQKFNTIILGNSRDSYNNHIDLLNAIQKSSASYGSFKMLFSYGIEDFYTKKIREIASTINNVEVIEEFMNLEDFHLLYKSSKTFVHNSYRQMALGNIFIALRNGVKVYLAEQNILKGWLLKNGILIFSVNDFIRDYENNNIELTKEQIKNNLDGLLKMADNHPITAFHTNILNIIE